MAGLEWRSHHTDGRVAYARIGPWPGARSTYARAGVRRNAVAGGSPSHAHAAAVWEAARVAASRSCAGGVAGGVIDLAMVSALGGHLVSCLRCWRSGPLDAATPAAWLTWGVRSRPALWRVFAPVLADVGVSRRGLKGVPTPVLGPVAE